MGGTMTRRHAVGLLAGAALGMAAGVSAACAADAPAVENASAADARRAMQWWQDTVVYECYPKSFLDTAGAGTGTLAGVTSQLDHIASLGTGAIWLTPVFKSPMKDNGYDVADYEAIDPSFGTIEDMDELIAQAGERGMKIVLDLVMNHTSDEHEWFRESSSSQDNPKADWYIWRDAKPDGGAPTNWRGIFGGSAWTWCEARQQYYLHTFADFQPDLNWECAEMREELFRIARDWIEKGVGGFRIDAIPYIKKPELADGEPDAADGLVGIHSMIANTPGILDFLCEFKEKAIGDSGCFTVAEANGVPSDELPNWVGSNGVFDMLFQFNHQNVPLGGAEIWYKPADWTLTDLKRELTASQAGTADNGWYPIYWENHDQPRSPNHFCPDVADKKAAAKMLGCVLYTLRGTPFVYQGEELGYTNVAWDSIDDYDDVSSHNQYAMALENGCTEAQALQAVHDFSRDNARTPMQWDAGANAGFTQGTPWLPVHDDYEQCNVAVQDADDESVLAWYRKLVELRAQTDVLVSGSYEELMADSESVYAYRRQAGQDVAVVLANFTEEETSFDPALVEGLSLVLSTHAGSTPGTLAPLEAAVYAGQEA